MSTKRWLGNAASNQDLWTVSLSGTVTSQTFSFTINGKSISYTSSGGDTVATILTAFVALWNQLTPANPPEFNELTAVGLPIGGPFTSMTLTGKTSGKPSAISVATGGAATFSIANTTPATGPNTFDNAQNWSGGVAPVNSDVLVYDNGSVPCLYNLSTALTGITVYVNPGYSGAIGLPLINSDSGTVTYNEYRTTSLTLTSGTAIIDGPSLTRCNLAFGANTTTVRIMATGQRPDQYIPIVLLTGGNGSSELDITRGDCGVAFYQGQTATFPTIKTGYVSSPLTDVTLICGTGATLTTVTQNGGNVTSRANVTTITQGASGGTLTLSDSATVTTLSVYAGTCNANSNGTITTANLYGSAILSFDNDPRAITVTNPINCNGSNVSVIDNQKRVNSGVLSLAMTGLANVKWQHGFSSSIVIT